MTNLIRPGATVGSTKGLQRENTAGLELLVDDRPPATWTQDVREFGGNVYHSLHWARICENDGNHPLYFRWKNHQGQTCGLALGCVSASDRPILRRLTRHLHFDTYPLSERHDIATVGSLIADIRKHALRERYLSLLVESYCAPCAAVDFASLGFDCECRIEFRLDLRPETEHLWNGLSTTLRRKIRKSRRFGLNIRLESTAAALQEMRRLQTESTNRRLSRGEAIPVQPDSHYERLGNGYLDEGVGRVALAYDDQEPVSAAFISVFGKEALYIWGGSSDRGFDTDAPALLFWDTIEQLQSQGIETFNFGGVPASAESVSADTHGLYRFKAGFGGEQVRLASGRINSFRPMVSRALSVARRLAGH